VDKASKPNVEETSIIVKQMLDIEVFPNLNQQVIMTTEDRLRICLITNLKKAEKKHDWVAPFGLLVAIVTTFTTASFKNFGLSAQTWEAIFIVGGIASVVWLIITVRHAFVKMNLEKIIAEIKTTPKSSENT
jgi:hypothetical protein